MLYHLTQLQFTVWSWTRCGFFQGRRWAPLSGWLTVTQTLKYNDCWHCFLLSLTLNGPFQGSAKSIFFFIFFLGLCVKSFFFFLYPTSILIVLSLLRVCTPWPQIEGDLVRGWIQAGSSCGAQQSASISSATECMRVNVYVEKRGWRGKVIGGWWDWGGGGSKREEARWPESFRKQLARCYTNFRTNLISCYQSCRTLCSARLQMCLWALFFSFCWILPLNCLYSFDWASRKMQICGTTDCFVY